MSIQEASCAAVRVSGMSITFSALAAVRLALQARQYGYRPDGRDRSLGKSSRSFATPHLGQRLTSDTSIRGALPR